MSDDAPIDYRRDVLRYVNLQEAAKYLAPDLRMCDGCQSRSADVVHEGYGALCRPCDLMFMDSIGKDN